MNTDSGTVVEFGAGTGLGTDVLLDTLHPAPLLVAEPSAHLRVVLLARLSARHSTEITRAVTEYEWWVTSAATVAAELAQAGATGVRIHEDLVIARAPAADSLGNGLT